METIELLSVTLGWSYCIAWSVSFYPQLLSNFRRKSVTGLSTDFVVASFYGFLCYSISNLCFYFIPSVKEEYQRRHGGNDMLVALNDVVFAVHATILTFVFCIQVYAYRKPNEGPSTGGLILAGLLTALIGTGAGMAYWRAVPMLDYLYLLSYIKLILTLIKYLPQAWMNWVRRSTMGWSISNVLLDLAGGFFSISQLCLDALTSGHLAGIGGFVTKLVLGIISIIFDTVFILQHYLWFPETGVTVIKPVDT